MSGDRTAGEFVVARLRPHAHRLLTGVLVLWVVAFLVPVLWSRVELTWWNPAIAALGVGLVFVFTAVPLLMWATRRTVITNRRVIVKGGLSGGSREVLLARIHDVEVRRSGRQRMVGAGDLVLSTGGGHGIRIVDVAGPRGVAATILELMEDAGFAPAELLDDATA